MLSCPSTLQERLGANSWQSLLGKSQEYALKGVNYRNNLDILDYGSFNFEYLSSEEENHDIHQEDKAFITNDVLSLVGYTI